MRTRIAMLLACLGIGMSLSLVGAADPSPEPPADVTCRLDSGAGAFAAKSGPTGTTVNVTNVGYQGNATFTFKMATPPRLKMHFANVRAMQTFTLGDGKRNYPVTTPWTGGRTVSYWDKNGRAVSNGALAAVTLVMEANKAGDLEVSLSTARDVELGTELKVYWVQYLRVKKGPDRFVD
jgi:hypothetical protein